MDNTLVDTFIITQIISILCLSESYGNITNLFVIILVILPAGTFMLVRNFNLDGLNDDISPAKKPCSDKWKSEQ